MASEAQRFDPKNWEPVKIGPTWTTDADGNFIMPRWTLGWGVAAWAATWLTNEDGDPWIFTNEQFRFVCWMYEVDANGRFVYQDFTWQRLKGHGKDPLAAVICLAELIGPCRFDYWDENHNPVGRDNPAAHVQLAAVSASQTANTMSLFPLYIPERTKLHYDIEMNTEKIRALGHRRKLEVITSSYRSQEGARPSFVLMNEALALDTPIPTPSGWTTMGELETGDVIHGADGRPTRVTKAFPVQVDRQCYRVSFADGTSVVASDGHLWSVFVSSNPNKLVTMTTQQMVDRSDRRYQTPRPGPRQAPEASLPLDPYLLGAWLGDGSTGACNITCGDEDVAEMQEILAARGVVTHRLNRLATQQAFRISFSAKKGFGADMGSPQAQALRKMPCYRDKHIPTEYLQASVAQRVELLQGLMDTDGCMSKQGIAIFVGRDRLTADVVKLLQGLGQVAGRTFAPDSRSRDGGCYRVTFSPLDIQPFALKRKAARVLNKQGGRHRKTTIKSIEAVASVPVRCIAVDAPDSLFQAGPTGQVTHNTHHWISSNGGHELYKVITRNRTKAKGGAARALQITNAYMPGEDSICEQTRLAYEKTITINPMTGKPIAAFAGRLYDSLEAPANAPLDPEVVPAIVERIRGDSHWLDIPSIVNFVLDTQNSPSESRRFWYNQIVSDEETLVPPKLWDPLARDGLEGRPLWKLEDGDEVVLGFDGSRTHDATALVAIRIRDQFIVPLGIWWNEKKADKWEVPREDVVGAVDFAFAHYKVQAYFADVHPWESYVDLWSNQYRDKLLIKAASDHWVGFNMSGHQQEITEANQRLVSGIADGNFFHDGNKTLRRHVMNTRRRQNSFGMTFTKDSRESDNHNDGWAATVLAFLALSKYLESGKRPKPPHNGKVHMFR